MSADFPGVPPPYVPPPPPGFAAMPTAVAPVAPGAPVAPRAPGLPDRGVVLRRLVGILTAMGVVAAAALAGVATFRDVGRQDPARWDPRVASLAAFVEQHRKLRFVHPVSVYFLSERAYAAVSGGTTGTPSTADREVAKRTAAEYRALGVLQGAPDLLDARRKMQASGTLAFYTPVDKVINVRGTTMTPSRRVTLVHELTHALQDQHFPIGRATAVADPDAAGAARAIVEGDAVATEQAYLDTLSVVDRRSYEAELRSDQEQATTELDGVPDVLQTVFGSYYAVGNAFVQFWDARADGPPDPRQLDEVLRRPPPTSAQLYDPRAYLAGDEPAVVSPPKLPGMRREFRSGRLGAGFLFVMLSERVDPALALRATDGLSGDAVRSGFVVADGVERMCVSATQTLSTAEDAAEFAGALKAWAAAMPDRAGTEVEEPGEGRNDATQVGFRTCDAGSTADVGLTGRSKDALVLPVVRLQAAAEVIGEGFGRDDALCFGTAVVTGVGLADLTASARTPALDRAIAAARAECS